MSSASTSPKSLTDWERVDALRDEDIDLSECPEVTPEMFAQAVVRRGGQPVSRRKKQTVYLDEDLLAWFKAQGRGYQQKINDVLRAYKEAHQGT